MTRDEISEAATLLALREIPTMTLEQVRRMSRALLALQPTEDEEVDAVAFARKDVAGTHLLTFAQYRKIADALRRLYAIRFPP